MSDLGLLLRELLPRGSALERWSVIKGELVLFYTTGQGIREQRTYILAATTRWPD